MSGHRSTRLESDEAERLTPNLKMIGRDKAHAFRRLMSRPYATDQFLDSIVEEYIRDKNSVVQKVQNSFDLKRMMAEEVEAGDSTTGPKMKSLRAAKHRFESLASPMGRVILYLPEFLKALQRIALKTDKAGASASAFLKGLTAEKLVQLGLLADGMDESLLLVRILGFSLVINVEFIILYHLIFFL